MTRPESPSAARNTSQSQSLDCDRKALRAAGGEQRAATCV